MSVSLWALDYAIDVIIDKDIVSLYSFPWHLRSFYGSKYIIRYLKLSQIHEYEEHTTYQNCTMI